MMILQHNNVRLDRYVTTMKKLDASLGMYLTAAKVDKCILVAEKRI